MESVNVLREQGLQDWHAYTFELIKHCINAKHSFSWQGGLFLNLHSKTGDEIINQDLQIINLEYLETLENLDLAMTSFYLHPES